MSFDITGKIIEIYEEVQVSDRFKKREFVIEKKDGEFTDQIKFQLVQDKTSLINSFKTGEDVKITFNIKGNKWKDTYFVNLQAWRLEKVTGAETTISDDLPPLPDVEDVPPLPDETDDLPF
jgi:single-strand DNA-binding protein